MKKLSLSITVNYIILLLVSLYLTIITNSYYFKWVEEMSFFSMTKDFFYDNINTIFTETTILDIGDNHIKFEEGVSNGISILTILDDLNFRMIEYNSIRNICNTSFIHNNKEPIYKSIIKSLEYYQNYTL